MSALIKGMEMPKRCEDCLLCNQYETVTMIACGCLVNMRTRELGCVTRPDWCPIMEVPDHGRLIDADALEHVIGKFSLNWEYGNGVSDCWDALLTAPTVIPAEPPKEET